MSDAGKAVVIGSVTPFASLDAMARELTAAFREAGQPAELIFADSIQADPAAFIARLRTWKNAPPRFLTGWNAKLHISTGGGAHICDVLDVPLLNLLIDHPASHYEHMARLPAKSVSGVCDRRHQAFLARAPWPRRASFFSPHGGPAPAPAPKPHAERALPAVFCGGVSAPPDLSAHLAAAAPGAGGARTAEAAARLLHQAEHEDADPGAAAAAACAELGHEAPFEGPAFPAFCRLIFETAAAAENRRRVKVLNAAAAAEVHVFGDIHPASGVKPRSGLIMRGRLPFAELPGVFAEARAVLNATPKVRSGGHERIFLALAQGCAQITDSNAYLDETLGADKGVCYWPDGADADFADVIDGLARSPARSEAAARRDAEAYARRHTWAARAADMLAAVEAL